MKRLSVALDFGDTKRMVGEIVRSGKDFLFKFYPEFIADPLPISPFKLPGVATAQRPNTDVFEGLFGVFHDSLPDGWGRLLVDRALQRRNINIRTFNVLDRLAQVGDMGMGALTYNPILEGFQDRPSSLDLDLVANQVQQVLAGTEAKNIDDLVYLTGSSGGARPKIRLGFEPSTGRISPDANVLPEGYEHWLIKFSAGTDPDDVGRIEFAYHQMALKAGLVMTPCRLFIGRSGKQYFGTQRFDRLAHKRRHMHSAAGLLHDNFRLSALDYGHLMDAALRLENDVRGAEKVFRLAAFNIYTHNRDDHSKNVSFLMDETGNWQLAPVYDLTFSRSSHGEHSITVAGEGRDPGKQHLMSLAEHFGIREPELILNEVRAAVALFPDLAQENGVSKESRLEITAAIKRQLREG